MDVEEVHVTGERGVERMEGLEGFEVVRPLVSSHLVVSFPRHRSISLRLRGHGHGRGKGLPRTAWEGRDGRRHR
jgi:hypothetical protein